MVDPTDSKIYLLLHVDGTKSEVPPNFSAERCLYACRHYGKIIKYLGQSSLNGTDASREWQTVIDELTTSFGKPIQQRSLTVLSHRLQQIYEQLYAEIKQDRRVIWHHDYSSRDPYYHDFWHDIRTAENCCQLVARMDDWVARLWEQTSIAEPIGRLKHRVFDQIGPIAKDIEILQVLYERHEWQEVKEHLNSLKREWQGEFPASHSLRSYLARMWYLMFGDHFAWDDLGIAPPADVNLIPAGYGTRLPLFEILRIGRMGALDKTSAWIRLLDLLQVSRSDEQRFACKAGHGVVRFACLMDDLIANPDAFDKAARYTGYGKQNSLIEEFNAFHIWFRDVNKNLQSLRGKWRHNSSSSATLDSVAD